MTILKRQYTTGIGWETVEAIADGLPAVSCMLAQQAGVDIRSASGPTPILWDGLYDNAWDFNALPAIPAGLALDFEFDGSSADITTTDTGIWSFTSQLRRNPNDATWRGSHDIGLGQRTAWLDNDLEADLIYTVVTSLSEGVTFTPNITVDAPATDNPYTAFVYLNVTRLG